MPLSALRAQVAWWLDLYRWEFPLPERDALAAELGRWIDYYRDCGALLGDSLAPDHAVVRAAVEATGKAALWLSGHVHWNTVTNVGNVQHVTVQSVSERFTTYPMTAAAYADLEIKDGQFTIDVFGNDPFHARLPFRRSGDRPWMAVRDPFTPADFQHDAEERRLELASA